MRGESNLVAGSVLTTLFSYRVLAEVSLKSS